MAMDMVIGRTFTTVNYRRYEPRLKNLLQIEWIGLKLEQKTLSFLSKLQKI